MSSGTPGASPQGAAANDSEGNSRRDQRDQQQRKPFRCSGNRESKFEGKCAELKSSVYDVVSGKDTFAKTTREIAEYVGREFNNAGKFRTGMVEMTLPTLVEPAPPATMDTSQISFELWKMARPTYEKKTEVRVRNSHRVYALLIGQCSQALHNQMEASERWGCINDTSDAMALLQLTIQGCMIQRQTRQKPVHSLLDAETHVFQFKQKGLANNDYYKNFKDLVTITECLGSDIRAHSDRVSLALQDVTVDPDMPMEEEMEHAKERAKDKYLAVMFLVNSDLNRYRDLVRGIENDYTRGSDTYPTTLSAAYDYLVNYRPASKMNPHDNDPELSFYNDDRPGCGQGRGGHGAGCGGGWSSGCGGRGNQGGRSGRRDSGGQPQDSHEQVHNQMDGGSHDDDDALFLVDNLDQVEDYSSLVYSHYLDSDFVGIHWHPR
jgi:hypothetical protein